MTILVYKRDKTVEQFTSEKIRNALVKALKGSNTVFDVDVILNEVVNALKNSQTIDIEKIQDEVEKSLMTHGCFATAKHYILYRQKRHDDRNSTSFLSKLDDIDVPWGPLGYVTFKRTYARLIEDGSGNTEEYRDAIIRVLSACQNQLHVGFSNYELKKAYTYLLNLKFSVAGRFLWQLGTTTVDKLGLMSLQNCAFTLIDHPIKPFSWIFDVLMLGVGVGFNIQKKNIDKLPPVFDANIKVTRQDAKDADFIIPDSREGWVKLLEHVLEAYFYTGKSFTYSTILVRGAGTPIKGFGGVASGPEDLCRGIDQIQTILQKRRGMKLNSIDCLDMVNIIASVVVAGNIRRCLPKDSMVHTERGLVEIQNIKVGDRVLTSDGYENVANVFVQGKQKLVKIVTEDGYFRCTPNHRMAVLNEEFNDYKWVMAKDLTKYDVLMTTREPIPGVNTSIPDFKNTKIDFTENIAWLLGYFYKQNKSDFDDYGFVLNVDNYEIALFIINILDNFDDAFIKIKKNKEKSYIIDCISSELSSYFVECINYIPNCIKKGVLSKRLAYIAGIMDSVGSFEKEEKYLIDSPDYNIQNLCYSCGIETQNKFGKLYLVTANSKNRIGNIPQLLKKFKNSYPTTTPKFTPVQVVSVVDEGEYEETYDIEVENKHEFYCNGYLTHNSALICMGDCDDVEYLNAKRWDLGNIPNWRALSNNSVVCNDIKDLHESFWEGYKGNGEPYGLINIGLSKKIGRIKDGSKYPDPDVEGFNPCLTGDTKILTKNGIKTIDELVGTQFIAVVDGKEYESTDQGFWKTGNKEVFKITLDNGFTVKATANHQFLTKNGWTEVEKLTMNSEIKLSSDYILKKSNEGEYYSGVNSIEHHGFEDVYDCTIPDIHCFSANGMIAHNCAEQNLTTIYTIYSIYTNY